jgi:hypothetical protein
MAKSLNPFWPALLMPSLILVFAGRAWSDEPDISCRSGAVSQQKKVVSGFEVRFSSAGDKCHAAVLSPIGKIAFETEAAELGLDKESGKDINGGGEPDLVLFAQDGPPAYGYTYSFVGLGQHPALLTQIQNGYGIWFKQFTSKGPIFILTADAGLRDLPGIREIYHFDLLIPEVIFRLRGDKLTDVSDQFQARYDAQIARAQNHLNPGVIERFRNERISNDFYRGEIKGWILTVVFSYLYSGRERQAWRALQQMWPTNDVAHVKKAILDCRSRGILSEVTPPASGSRELPGN